MILFIRCILLLFSLAPGIIGLNLGIIYDESVYLSKVELEALKKNLMDNLNPILYAYFDTSIARQIPTVNASFYSFNLNFFCNFINDGNEIAISLLTCTNTKILDEKLSTGQLIHIALPDSRCNQNYLNPNTILFEWAGGNLDSILSSFFKMQRISHAVVFKDKNSKISDVINHDWNEKNLDKIPITTFDLEILSQFPDQLKIILDNNRLFIFKAELQSRQTLLNDIYQLNGFDQTKFWLILETGGIAPANIREPFLDVIANKSISARLKQPNIAVITPFDSLDSQDCSTFTNEKDVYLNMFFTKAINCKLEKYPIRLTEFSVIPLIISVSYIKAIQNSVIDPQSLPGKRVCSNLAPVKAWNDLFLLVKDTRSEFGLSSNRYLHSLKTDFMRNSIEWAQTAQFNSNSSELVLSEFGQILSQNPLLSGLYPNQFHTFHNKTLFISTVTNPPFVSGTFNPDNTVSNVVGFTHDIVLEMAEKLNFIPTYINPADNQTGSLVNGKWTGIVGDVLYSRAEFGIGPISTTPARSTVVEFMSPFMNDGVGILIPKPLETNKMFRMLNPFHWTVWCILISILLVTGVVMWLISYLSPLSAWNLGIEGAISDEIKVRENIWSVTASILQQGTEFYPNAHSTRIVLCTWWIMCVVIVASYQADMTSFLTRKIYEPTVNSLTDIANTDIVFPIIKAGTSTLDYFRNANAGSIPYEVNKKLNNMPVILSNDEGLELLIKTRKYAVFGDRTQLKYMNVKNCDSTRLLPDNFNILPMAFPFRQNTEYIHAFDFYMLKMKESGTINKLVAKWWKSDVICSDSATNVETLDIDSCGGPFILYGVFIVLAFLTLSLEILISKWRKKKKIDMNKPLEENQYQQQTNTVTKQF